MKKNNFTILFFIFLLQTPNSQLLTSSYADTIYTKDGQEMKGIVVEDYRDRITFSTPDGEITVMKANMAELRFDTEEDNLIKLGELAQERKDFDRAYAYYDMARKLNPNSKRAKDGLVYVHGYMFRKEEVEKQEAVQRQEEFERYGPFVDNAKSKEDGLKENVERLKKTLGIELRIKEGLPEIGTIDRYSAAYKSGMRSGDLLVSVWGRLSGYMSLKEVTDVLLDKPALEIKCAIERTIPININGLGASFKMEFDGLTVSKVDEGSSAFEAGLNKDDLVVAIDGQSTRYMPLKKAEELIRDSKEKIVKLTIRRELMLWREDKR